MVDKRHTIYRRVQRCKELSYSQLWALNKPTFYLTFSFVETSMVFRAIEKLLNQIKKSLSRMIKEDKNDLFIFATEQII